ncbi:MAG: hypothetical protein ACI3VB_03575 [Oscillospiraceae bacterium]
MTIIKAVPETSGAHANQTIAGRLEQLPDGWFAVPTELETAAMAFLPWVALEITDGKITAIAENAAAREAFEQSQTAEIKSEGGEE